MADEKLRDLRAGQVIMSLFWTFWYKSITVKVLEAPTSALGLSIQVVKGTYVLASLFMIISVVHAFWGWHRRLLAMEERFAEPLSAKLFFRELWGIARRSIAIVAYVAAFFVTTFQFFPAAGLNAFEIALAAGLWPTWMVSAAIAVVGRLLND